MEVSVIKKPKLVVAIDVGSTYSGYAWQWRENFEKNRSNVEFNNNWGTGALQLHKTATCLLLDQDKKVNSIGYQAEQRFCNLMDRGDEITDTWFFFKRFKTLLYRENFNDEIGLDDYNGQVLPFKLVMSSFIKGLKDHFLNMMQAKFLIKGSDMDDTKQADKNKEILDFKSILWVLTLPAIWSDKAKIFMRQAAEKAGIEKNNLLLALEPEAAALYCINLPPEMKASMNNFGEKGDKFIVCDLGGGTADISALKVLEDGRLQELCAGAGSLVGGQNINDAFFQVCKDVFEGNVWHEIAIAKNAAELFEMEKDFEQKKVAIGSCDEMDQYIWLKIPGSLEKMLKEGSVRLKNAEEVNEQFKVDAGKFSFKANYIRKKLFAETVGNALKAIEESIKRVRTEISTVVLVGGFAESPIVVENVRQMLLSEYPNVKVAVPTSPFKAVLHGAVLFGHDPMIFRSRVSRATFGVRTNSLFKQGKHDETKKFKHKETNELYCGDIFDFHVKKGQSVILGNNLEKKTYLPLYKDQISVGLDVFASNSEEPPMYTTDPGCKQIAKVEVDVSSTVGKASRKVNVMMMYGGTELSVIAIEENTGLEYSTKFNFDTL